MLLGVTSEVTAKEGSSGSPASYAPFVGLVKERAGDWIRPTFLGQTDVTSFSLDFTTDTLVLSRREQIPRELRAGTMSMVDLRPLGSPVFHYAVAVEELWINGSRHKTDVPIYVVFDSGTTGMLVDRDLFYNSDLSLGTFECHMKMRGEDGSRVQIGSSLRTCTSRCLFLTLPIDVPWDGVRRARPTSSSRVWRSCSTRVRSRWTRTRGGYGSAAVSRARLSCELSSSFPETETREREDSSPTSF